MFSHAVVMFASPVPMKIMFTVRYVSLHLRNIIINISMVILVYMIIVIIIISIAVIVIRQPTWWQNEVL